MVRHTPRPDFTWFELLKFTWIFVVGATFSLVTSLLSLLVSAIIVLQFSHWFSYAYFLYLRLRCVAVRWSTWLLERSANEYVPTYFTEFRIPFFSVFLAHSTQVLFHGVVFDNPEHPGSQERQVGFFSVDKAANLLENY